MFSSHSIRVRAPRAERQAIKLVAESVTGPSTNRVGSEPSPAELRTRVLKPLAEKC